MGLLDIFKAKPVVKPRLASFASNNDVVSRGSYLLAQKYDNRRQESQVYLDAYLHGPWVKPCVDMIARSASKNWRLVPADNKNELVDPVAVAPILDFLNAPNDIDTWASLSAKIVRDMIVQGSCMLYIGRSAVDKTAVTDAVTKAFLPYANGITNIDQEIQDVVGEVAIDGLPVWLKVLPFQQMEVIPDSDGRIVEYQQWTIDGRRIRFQPAEIIHIFHPLSSSSTYGDSVLTPLVQIITTDALIDRRQKKILQGDIVLDALFTLPDGTNEEDVKRVYEHLNVMYKKNGADATFFVSSGDIKYENVSKSKDGDFLKQGEDNRNTIAMHLGISLSVMGDTTGSSSTYGAGTDNALRNYLENTVRPLTNHIEHFCNRDILAAFGNVGLNYVLEYVLEDADDAADIETMYSIAIANGTMTRNEKRQKLGLDPIPNGDVITVTAGAVCSTLDTIINPPQPPAPNAPSADVTKAVEDARSALRVLRKAL